MEISNIKLTPINGPSIIPTIEQPVLKSMEVPVIRGMELPIINMPSTRINYPTLNVPTREQFDDAVRTGQKEKEEPKEEKSRGLPDTKPTNTPAKIQAQQSAQPSVQPQVQVEIPADTPQPTFTFNGVDINLPDPSLVATAGSVAVVTTAATVVSTAVFNALKNAAEPLIREAAKNKFKIKIKQVKPVLHYVLTDSGKIDIFEYSTDGTKLIDQTDNVENYIRAQVETNSLYEIENKIIIDDVIQNKFTKEGQKRFKSLFTPAKKVAKKLSARLSF